MGVVINRESPLLLQELCGSHEIPYIGDPEKLVRLGGPVQPEQGLVIYSEAHEDPEGRAVCSGLHVSASTGTLTRLCNDAKSRFQCYTGYAGWAPGQLESELVEGSWFPIELEPDDLFTADPDELWWTVLGRQSGPLGRMRHFPHRVSDN